MDVSKLTEEQRRDHHNLMEQIETAYASISRAEALLSHIGDGYPGLIEMAHSIKWTLWVAKKAATGDWNKASVDSAHIWINMSLKDGIDNFNNLLDVANESNPEECSTCGRKIGRLYDHSNLPWPVCNCTTDEDMKGFDNG